MKAAIYHRKTLPDLLVSSVRSFPGKGIGFAGPDGHIEFLTYKELLSKAERLAGGLQAAGLMPEDKVMIVMTRNQDIVPILWGCFLGGLIPTILQPPVSFTEFNQPAQKIENVYRILKNPKVILSDDLFLNFQSGVITPESLINAKELNKDKPVEVLYAADENDTAFIQFSSGSTGDPKGIVLSHKNLLINLAAICNGLDVYDTDVFTNWMPLYHDMGLVGYHLCPVFGNCDQFLIDPIDFVKRPVLWPEVMDTARCTITGCPNFGQALLLRYLKNREIKPLNLSSVKAIVNGAEPISNRIMSEFMNSLAVHHLRKESMLPAYGMAEASLAITFSELFEEPTVTSFNRARLQIEGRAVPETGKGTEIIELVSLGKALNDTELRVVDEYGHPVEAHIEGNIQIRGGGITSGYYNSMEETRKSFDGDWLKTGDKGFIYNGNLYITGRVKDIIFVHGQNLYAHDLENLAGKFSDISYGKVIIGGLFDAKKGHDLILLFLVGSANQATCDAFLSLRKFFRDTYGINIDLFIPIRSNQVPKTSSGKIQRYKLIADYQNGLFDEAVSEIKKLIKEKD